MPKVNRPITKSRKKRVGSKFMFLNILTLRCSGNVAFTIFLFVFFQVERVRYWTDPILCEEKVCPSQPGDLESRHSIPNINLSHRIRGTKNRCSFPSNLHLRGRDDLTSSSSRQRSLLLSLRIEPEGPIPCTKRECSPP